MKNVFIIIFLFWDVCLIGALYGQVVSHERTNNRYLSGQKSSDFEIDKSQKVKKVVSTLADLHLTQYIDPFIGTAAHGHTFPGAVTPFGMIQLSPDNGRSGWDWCSGYNYSDSLIAGFSHTHLSGTGIGDLCDISFIPFITDKELSPSSIPKKVQSKFTHKNESASAGYYSVELEDSGIKVELTATERTGIQKYIFPQSKSAYILLDLGFAINWDSPIDTYIKIENDSTISGYRFSKGWATDQKVYFTTHFSKPFSSFILSTEEELTLHSNSKKENIIKLEGGKSTKSPGDSTSVAELNSANGSVTSRINKTPAYIQVKEVFGKKLRLFLQYNTTANETILIKTAISSASIEGAKKNLDTDKFGWNFEDTHKYANGLWEKELQKIKITTNDESSKRTFYTALYHSLIAPSLYSDIDGNYKSPDSTIQNTNRYKRYTIFSLWDTFRAAHPLFTLIESDKINDFINSMLGHYKETGLLPVWELMGNETGTMIGYHAIPIITDAILKGFDGFDINLAYEAMKNSAMQNKLGLKYWKELGYIPSDKENESVSKGLEYAYDDWCIAQIAKQLNKNEDYEYFISRSNNYKNFFDSSLRFMRGKDSDGKWKVPFNPRYSNHRDDVFTEGNSWQYSWFAPHDIPGLINLMGGAKEFVTKLDSLFSIDSKIDGENASSDISGLIGQYAHGNEPSHHIAYLYNYAGAPAKTQAIINKIITSLYFDKPDGLSGNEDCGQMSAWYVFSALGFYPVNPANQLYSIGTPQFEKAEITIPNGNIFTIIAERKSKENIFIQSVELNGKIIDNYSINHTDIINGGTLKFVMSRTPKE
ncbi:MAG: GH92 family glycosyl hydrolase [Melioribacteraceae bacterium]